MNNTEMDHTRINIEHRKESFQISDIKDSVSKKEMRWDESYSALRLSHFVLQRHSH